MGYLLISTRRNRWDHLIPCEKHPQMRLANWQQNRWQWCFVVAICLHEVFQRLKPISRNKIFIACILFTVYVIVRDVFDLEKIYFAILPLSVAILLVLPDRLCSALWRAYQLFRRLKCRVFLFLCRLCYRKMKHAAMVYKIYSLRWSLYL